MAVPTAFVSCSVYHFGYLNIVLIPNTEHERCFHVADLVRFISCVLGVLSGYLSSYLSDSSRENMYRCCFLVWVGTHKELMDCSLRACASLNELPLRKACINVFVG